MEKAPKPAGPAACATTAVIAKFETDETPWSKRVVKARRPVANLAETFRSIATNNMRGPQRQGYALLIGLGRADRLRPVLSGRCVIGFTGISALRTCLM